MTADTVRDDRDQARYLLDFDGGSAFAAYRKESGGIIAVTHTEVPEAAEGKGIGSALVKGMLADIRARRLKLVPLCPFVAAYIARHPEWQDLIA